MRESRQQGHRGRKRRERGNTEDLRGREDRAGDEEREGK